MPRGSAELTHARRTEIIDACAALYETKNFKDITIKEIGAVTSFTRTSIYNYFRTKEEIFLALFQREYELWIADLTTLHDENEELSANGFAAALATSLERRPQLLKLLAMNMYDMEETSRMDCLIEFKIAYGGSIRTVERCLAKFFPELTERGRQDFIYAFFPFIYGVYPYAVVTSRQREAMAHAGIVFRNMSIYELVYQEARMLLGA